MFGSECVNAGEYGPLYGLEGADLLLILPYIVYCEGADMACASRVSYCSLHLILRLR